MKYAAKRIENGYEYRGVEITKNYSGQWESRVAPAMDTLRDAKARIDAYLEAKEAADNSTAKEVEEVNSVSSNTFALLGWRRSNRRK